MFSTEFTIIGLSAGMVGAILGSLLASVLVAELLESRYRFMWIPTIVAIVATAGLTVFTAWLASFGIFDRKPLDILREPES